MKEFETTKVQFGFASENSSFIPEEQGIDGEIFIQQYSGKIYLGKKLVATNVGRKISGGEVFNNYSDNVASGINSHSEGHCTTSTGYASHTEGIGTIASNDGEHASGMYNKSSENTLFSIGNGTSEERNNAFEVTKDGTALIGNQTVAQAFIVKGGEGNKVLLDNGTLKDLSDFAQKQDVEIKHATIVMSEQGFENQQKVESINQSKLNISFNKGEGSTYPAYYTSGESVRLYSKNKMTISGPLIKKIVFEFGSSDGNNEITCDVGKYQDGIWNGNHSNVTFTIGGEKGNRRIQTLTITYEIEASESDSQIILEKIELIFQSLNTIQSSIDTINTNIDKVEEKVDEIEDKEIIWNDVN